MEPNRIPSEPIVAVIRDYLGAEERRMNGTFRSEVAINLLAERIDLNGETLQKLLVGRRKTIDFDVADRLLCVLGKNDLWHGDLSDLYEAAMLTEGRRHFTIESASGKRVCARRGCSVQFVVPNRSPRKRYCSNVCRSTAWKHKTLKTKTTPRGKYRALEALVCRHGHPRTKENTGTNSAGYRFCLICHKASQRRWEEKHRASQRERAKETHA